jgi:hypothetical protein
LDCKEEIKEGRRKKLRNASGVEEKWSLNREVLRCALKKGREGLSERGWGGVSASFTHYSSLRSSQLLILYTVQNKSAAFVNSVQNGWARVPLDTRR